MFLLLLAQAVAGPVHPAAVRPRSDAPCPIAATADVVVCARTAAHYRLRPPPPRPDKPILPKAQIGFGSAKLAAEAEQETLNQGLQARRLMVRLKLPLGRKRTR